MATSLFPLFVPLLLFFYPSTSQADIHKADNLFKFHHRTENLPSSLVTKPLNDTPPTLYFEVTKPLKHPMTEPCKYLLLQHDFGYTYGKPPVLADYTFPSNCPYKDFSKIVLEWNATCKGRQFDRIFGVWLSGVELLRSCTAEPLATGIVWSVKKDITRYHSLLVKNETQDFAVYLGNIVDSTYTGVYHVNVSIHFYPKEGDSGYEGSGLPYGDCSAADLILPISRNLPLNDGLWFEIENSTDVESKEFEIPQNVYRAVLEVYVSFHENDEFWYRNYPNDYIIANNLTDAPGNGPFREVLVSLDGVIVGAVWPFTVIFTGGINPWFWRPITGIGSFDLPSYDIEITPFLGNLLDGKSHQLGFSVTNALNVWFIDANLHLWLDHKSKKTKGKILKHESKPLDLSNVISNFKGLNGTFVISAIRSVTSTGWVKSSYGKLSTRFDQHFGYSNAMEMENDGDLQIVNQTIHFNDSVSVRNLTSLCHSLKSFKDFKLGMYLDWVDQGNDSALYITNVTLGFNDKNSRKDGFALATASSLKNMQKALEVMVVKNNSVVSAVGGTQEVYQFHDSDFCYFRNISSSNFAILYDKQGSTCNGKKEGLGHGSFL